MPPLCQQINLFPMYEEPAPDPPSQALTIDDVWDRPPQVPLVVSDGLGVDSTAALILLKRLGIRPDRILFADTGGEKRETYQYITNRRAWLARNGFPELEIVRKVGRRVPDTSLEEEVLRLGLLPAFAYGKKSCSLKHKVAPQEIALNHWAPARRCWRAGGRVVKLIGYDAGPSDGRRLKRWSDQKYSYWYALRDPHCGGYDREGCVELIREEGEEVPVKSACFYCPASKKPEILWLYEHHPDLLARALAIEDNAQPKLRKTKGLGRRFRWRDFLAEQGLLGDGRNE